MAKIYEFEQHKKEKEIKASLYYETPDRQLICNLIETLILTYKKRIGELEDYKKEIARENGKRYSSPRELIKGVKKLQQMLLQYGISCNYFRFYSMEALEVIYYNETSLIYVVRQEDVREGLTYTTGEFIEAFEGYYFDLHLDGALFKIFDKQISNLNTTIETLNNTEV